jgi:hypothetical protein
VPVSGSAYTYGYATLGELVAWIIGWDLVLEYALGAATVAVGWSAYVVSLLHDVGVGLPARFVAAPGTVVSLADGSTVSAIVNIPAILVSLAATTLLVIGIRESSRVNAVIVAVKVGVVVAIILIGSFFVVPSLWQPFIPPNEGSFGAYGWSGVLRGAGVIFFAYIGFDAVSTAAQEARRPQRDMPVGIIGSLVVCTVLYVLVSAVMVGLVSFRELGVAAPMATAVDAARIKAQDTSWAALLNVMPLVDDHRADDGAAAHLHGDGGGWAASGLGGARPSAVSNAARDHADYRRHRHPRLGVHADRRARRAREHRDALRVRRGLAGCARASPHPPRPAAPVPRSWFPGGPDCLGAGVPRADGQPPVVDLGAPADLDGDWRRDLRRVRSPPQQAGTKFRCDGRGTSTSRDHQIVREITRSKD